MEILLASIASGIGVVSVELLRLKWAWGQMAVSLFWAVCAVVLILLGFRMGQRALRHLGLGVFVLCAIKVILIDSTQLSGLPRIGAYMGSGILILFLSLLYQKASERFRS